MADPFTLSFIAANCVWGAVKGLSGQTAVAAAKRSVDALRKQQTPENHEVLAATHAAFVRSIQFMADACGKSGGEPKDQFSARALSKLAASSDLTDFRFGTVVLPKKELDLRVRAIFEGADPDPAVNATEIVIAQVEEGMAETLTETHRNLFHHGSDKHRSWPQAFELFFAEEVKEKERVFRGLAFDRLNEVVAFAVAHASDLARLHDRLGDFQGEMRDRIDRVDRDNVETHEALARMEAMLAQQTGVPLPTLREIARAFGELQPEADAADIESYLWTKAGEYHLYRERSEATEARDNHSRVLLGQAQDAIDAGHFEDADRLLASAEDHDEKVSRELRLSADQRDVDRAAKRALRGDAARLRGVYQDAIAHYDLAVEILPSGARLERFRYLWSAARASFEWAERFGGPQALSDSLGRWRQLSEEADRTAAPEDWANYQVGLGAVLHLIGQRTQGIQALKEALQVHQEALEVFTRVNWPAEWATIQLNLASLHGEIGKREPGAGSFEAAVIASHHALEVHTRERYPDRWATIHSNLGAIYSGMGILEGSPDKFSMAIASCRSSLEVRTREKHPLAWAKAKSVLGASLAMLAKYTADPTLLNQSAAALREALEVYSVGQEPVEWASTQNSLGIALRLAGVLSQDAHLVHQAVDAYRSALEVYDRDEVPLQWAQTTNNLAVALQTLAGLEDNLRRLFEAADLYQAVCDVFVRDDEPVRWAMAVENLAVVRSLIGAATQNVAMVDESIMLFEAALEIFADPALARNRDKAEYEMACARDVRTRLS